MYLDMHKIDMGWSDLKAQEPLQVSLKATAMQLTKGLLFCFAETNQKQ